MAVLQAMAAGTPCVLTDIPAFEPLHEVAAIAGVDDVDGLSEKLLELATNKERRQELSEDGYELVKQEYSIKKTAQEYAKIYSEITRD